MAEPNTETRIVKHYWLDDPKADTSTSLTEVPDRAETLEALHRLWKEAHIDAGKAKAGGRASASLLGKCNAYVNAIGRVVKGRTGTYFDGVDWLKIQGEQEPFQ